MSGDLSERELRTLVAIVEDGRRDSPNQAIPWATMDGLVGLIECDSLIFKELNVLRETVPLYQSVDNGDRTLEFDGNGGDDDGFWALRRDFLPCSYPYRTGDLTSVIKWSDFYTSTQLRDAAMFADLYGLEGRKHCMLLTMPAAPGTSRRIMLLRDTGSDFGERDRLLLQLLRPHLYEIYLRAQRRTADAPRLSQRELEVLQLAAQGHSNAEIARHLFISVGTVRKHMEHIFDRTGVRNRAKAAALVMPHLSIDPLHRGHQPRLAHQPYPHFPQR